MSELIAKYHELGWVLPPVVAIAVGIALMSLKKLLWARLEVWAGRTTSNIDDLLLTALKSPTTALILILSVWIGFNTFPPEIKDIRTIQFAFKILSILTAVWIIDRIASVLISSIRLEAGMGSGLRSLAKTFVRAGIYGVGLMIILDSLGVSITPLLASLGVGSLAVALALQDTLGNFFSGMYLQFDQPVRLRDYIRLEDGSEGFVEIIGWRSTHVRLTSNNTIIIPNSKLSSSVILNYSMPDPETIVTMQVGVAYGCSLEHVEQVTLEVAKAVMQTSKVGVRSFDPVVRYHTFGDSSINFLVVLRAKHWTDAGELKHDFIKALHARYLKEGIDIPFPQRVVHYAKGPSTERPL